MKSSSCLSFFFSKKQTGTYFQKPSMIDSILIVFLSLGLLVFFSQISGMFHLGVLGIALGQILAILGPAIALSHKNQSKFTTSVGLFPFHLRASVFGVFFGIFWFFFLLLWASKVFELITPSSLEEQKRTLSLLHSRVGFRPLWMDIGLIAVLPAFCEEILFRGILFPAIVRFFMQRSVSAATAQGIGILLSSIFFGCFHLSLSKFLPTFFLGLGFCSAMIITKSLWAGIFMHAVNNSLVLILLRMNLPHDHLSLEQTRIFSWVLFFFFICALGSLFLFRNQQKGILSEQKTLESSGGS